MNRITWINYTCKNENTQKLLEEKAEMLLLGPLKEKDEYQKEKALKAFSEGLGYLESVLLHDRGIHPSKLDLVKLRRNPKVYAEKLKEVENIMKKEISRQYRHFITFL